MPSLISKMLITMLLCSPNKLCKLEDDSHNLPSPSIWIIQEVVFWIFFDEFLEKFKKIIYIFKIITDKKLIISKCIKWLKSIFISRRRCHSRSRRIRLVVDDVVGMATSSGGSEQLDDSSPASFQPPTATPVAFPVNSEWINAINNL